MSNINKKNNVYYVRKIFKIDLIIIPLLIIAFMATLMFLLWYYNYNFSINDKDLILQQIQEIINKSPFMFAALPLLSLSSIISLLTCFAYKIFIYSKIQNKDSESIIFKKIFLTDILLVTITIILYITADDLNFKILSLANILFFLSYKILLVSKIRNIDNIFQNIRKIFSISIIKYFLLVFIQLIPYDSIRTLIFMTFLVAHIYEIIIVFNDLNNKKIEKNFN